MSIKIFFTILLLNFSGFCQNIIINGSFESNIANHTENWIALTESEYDSVVNFSNSKYFSNSPNTVHGVDLIDSNFNNIANNILSNDGEWHLTINAWKYQGDTIFGHEGITLELSSSLVKGNTYKLSFYAYSLTLASQFENIIKIGLSNNSKSLGSEIFSISNPDSSTWELFEYEFTPENSANYLSVWAVIDGYGAPLTGIDNFILTSLTSTKETLANNVKVYPNPFSNKLVIEGEKLANSRIFDLQGRVIFEQVINKGKNNLDLSNLEKGIYVIDVDGLKQKIVKE